MTAANSRRSFLKKSGLLLGASFAGGNVSPAAENPKRYKAAVIGRTGRGNYGHGLDTIFNDLDNVTVVAIADESKEGLQKAAVRSGAKRTYLDFREMLQKEKPDLVSVASRQPDCHKEMAVAAIEAGAHVYMEKPITESPDEADAILEAAAAKKRTVSVAHTRRFRDHFLLMRKLLSEGLVGDILDIRFQGKQDRRVGGEDLIVLGTHDMDIMRFILGDPNWCFASVMENGRAITKSDGHKGNEPYTVAGSTIRAEFAFDRNIHCRWDSVKCEEWNRSYDHKGKSINKWGFDIFGTKRILSHQESIGTFVLDFPFIAPNDSDVQWKPLASYGSFEKPPHLTHPIRDLIHAIETDTSPQCSGEDARWAVEMVCAVYRSQLEGKRVSFPLEKRGHPLRE